MTKFEAEDHEIKAKHIRPSSSLKVSTIASSTEQMNKIYDNVEKDIQLYTDARINEHYSKSTLNKIVEEQADTKLPVARANSLTKTHMDMTRPAPPTETAEKLLVKTRDLMRKSNTILNGAQNKIILAEKTYKMNENSLTMLKPPLSSESRRNVRQKTSANMDIDPSKTQDNFGKFFLAYSESS